MIDAYLWGGVDRISPEAPVPIVAVERREQRLGGAANVALNLRAMGAKPIICTVLGDDQAGLDFASLLDARELSAQGLVSSSLRSTTVKTRIISGNQQMLRVDEESTDALSEVEQVALLNQIDDIISSQKVEVIILEDYNKGVLTPEVIAHVVAVAKTKDIPVAVDPKLLQFFDFAGVTLFKPNLKELREGLKREVPVDDPDAFQEAVADLRNRLPHALTLVTLSERGVYITDGSLHHYIPAHIRKISDVSGAGDTVISVAALCLAMGAEPVTLATLANLAGGQVCERLGVVPVDAKQLHTEALALLEPA